MPETSGAQYRKKEKKKRRNGQKIKVCSYVLSMITVSINEALMLTGGVTLC